MTDLDLERLGDVWRQPPAPDELAELRRSAETVRRRARWAQLADLVTALAVGGIVLVLVLSNPKIDTFLVGGAAILVLLFGQYRQRRLRQDELRGLAGSTQEMLDQSIARVEATRKRARFQLFGIVPSFLLGLGVAALVDLRSGGGFLTRVAEPRTGVALALGAILFLAFAARHFSRAARSSQEESERLQALRDSYEDQDSPAVTETNAGEGTA
jgi:hypothetical protein